MRNVSVKAASRRGLRIIGNRSFANRNGAGAHGEPQQVTGKTSQTPNRLKRGCRPSGDSWQENLKRSCSSWMPSASLYVERAPAWISCCVRASVPLRRTPGSPGSERIPAEATTHDCYVATSSHIRTASGGTRGSCWTNGSALRGKRTLAHPHKKCQYRTPGRKPGARYWHFEGGSSGFPWSSLAN